MRTVGLLLAAGSSRRMRGPNKLLIEIDGVPLVRRTVLELLQADLDEIVVVTGFEESRVRDAISDLNVRVVFNPAFALGMHASIRAGLLGLTAPCDAFFVCLSDQPGFDLAVLRQLRRAQDTNSDGRIFVPSFEGRRGHPVLLSAEYIPEILAEPDGDHGCAYLFERHVEAVRDVSWRSDGVLIDIDTPEALARVQTRLNVADPVAEFLDTTLELRIGRRPYAVATVIETIGSSSARVGSKAIFGADGVNLLGWVGGGCAERFIGDHARRAIIASKAVTVLADLDDEVFGLGVACGGAMRVFIEPFAPAEAIVLPATPFPRELASLCGRYGWAIVQDRNLPAPATPAQLLLTLADAVAKKRGTSKLPLRTVKPVRARFRKSVAPRSRHAVVVGRTRITEALARHLSLAGYHARVVGPGVRAAAHPPKCECLDQAYGEVKFRAGEAVFIASHTSQDPTLVARALAARAGHVAMIGSLKRSLEVLTHLDLVDAEVNQPLFVPAGLDLDAQNPDEIALSVVAEFLSVREDAWT